jgi:hypothetical protein
MLSSSAYLEREYRSMKALVCSKYNSLEHLNVADVLRPVPKDNEILVKVCATPVKTGDWRTQSLKATISAHSSCVRPFYFRRVHIVSAIDRSCASMGFYASPEFFQVGRLFLLLLFLILPNS